MNHLRFTPGNSVYIYDPARKTFDCYGKQETRYGISPETAHMEMEEKLKRGGGIHLFTEGTQDADDAIALVESLRS